MVENKLEKFIKSHRNILFRTGNHSPPVNFHTRKDRIINPTQINVDGNISSKGAPQSDAPAFPYIIIKNTHTAIPDKRRTIHTS